MVMRKSRALKLRGGRVQSDGDLGSKNREKRELNHGECEVDEKSGRKCY